MGQIIPVFVKKNIAVFLITIKWFKTGIKRWEIMKIHIIQNIILKIHFKIKNNKPMLIAGITTIN